MGAATAVLSVMAKGLLLMVMVCAGTTAPARLLVFRVATGVPKGMAVDKTWLPSTWYLSTKGSCVAVKLGAPAKAVLVGANNVKGPAPLKVSFKPALTTLLTKVLKVAGLTCAICTTLSTPGGTRTLSTTWMMPLTAFTSAAATLAWVRALTQASVAAADVNAVNGIIHVVDKVLVPPGVLNVVQMAQVNPATFSTLVSKVVSAGLKDTLSGAGPFTLFAPTNTAFAGAPSLTATQLPLVLKYHVLGSQVLSTAIPFGTPVATLNTNNLAGAVVPAQTITINSSPLAITDKTAVAAPITATDVRASNGVIHVLSKVLIPN